MQNKMKRIGIVLLAVVLVVAGVQIYQTITINKAMEAALDSNAVATSEQNAENTNAEHVLTGVLAPVQSYTITASVVGKVKSVHVENGDAVEQGAVLLQQDPTDVQLQAGQGGTSQELLLRLKATYDLAEETYQKNQVLFEQGAVPEMTLKQSETQRNTALLQYQGTANLVAEQTQKTTVTSPGKGIVTGFNLKPGDSLAAGTAVATVVDLSQMVITVNVPESWLGSLSEGQLVPVNIIVLGETLDGTITYISPVASGSGQVFPIKITIDNQEGLLKAGMACSASL